VHQDNKLGGASTCSERGRWQNLASPETSTDGRHPRARSCGATIPCPPSGEGDAIREHGVQHLVEGPPCELASGAVGLLGGVHLIALQTGAQAVWLAPKPKVRRPRRLRCLFTNQTRGTRGQTRRPLKHNSRMAPDGRREAELAARQAEVREPHAGRCRTHPVASGSRHRHRWRVRGELERIRVGAFPLVHLLVIAGPASSRQGTTVAQEVATDTLTSYVIRYVLAARLHTKRGERHLPSQSGRVEPESVGQGGRQGNGEARCRSAWSASNSG
jgi:hypothetical protein